MSWHDAFLRQAGSDESVRRRLNDSTTEYSHRLHYLQMVTEKLAKAFLVRPTDADAPPTSHKVFVRFLRTLKGLSHLQRQLGYNDVAVFRRFVDSLLDLADSIQRLAPNEAHLTQPNPEYPWRDLATGEVVAPVDYDFPQFAPSSSKMIKLEKLVVDILRIAN